MHIQVMLKGAKVHFQSYDIKNWLRENFPKDRQG